MFGYRQWSARCAGGAGAVTVWRHDGNGAGHPSVSPHDPSSPHHRAGGASVAGQVCRVLSAGAGVHAAIG